MANCALNAPNAVVGPELYIGLFSSTRNCPHTCEGGLQSVVTMNIKEGGAILRKHGWFDTDYSRPEYKVE